jgi:cytochrome c-type biogenesis protein
MTLFVVAFISGMLTALAPCVLPILPVILGTVATQKSAWTPYVVIGSLSLSIIIFTVLLKATVLFIVVPLSVWALVSGTILTVFGFTLVFPHFARYMPRWGGGTRGMSQFVGKSKERYTFVGDVLVGASLGPIFSSCSPTYFVILGTVLPLSFFLGLFYIALFGSAVIRQLAVFSDPHGSFKKFVGILFIALGMMIAFGIEKKVEVGMIKHLPFDVTLIEYALLERFIYE